MSKLFSTYCQSSKCLLFIHSTSLKSQQNDNGNIIVETVISSMLLVCLFSQVPLPSLAFASFLLTELMNVWGGSGKEWGDAHWSSGPALEGFSECRQHSCRDCWVEVGSLDKP